MSALPPREDFFPPPEPPQRRAQILAALMLATALVANVALAALGAAWLAGAVSLMRACR